MKLVSSRFLLLLFVMFANGNGAREKVDDHSSNFITHSEQLKLQGNFNRDAVRSSGNGVDDDNFSSTYNVLRLPSEDRTSEDGSVDAHHQHAMDENHVEEISHAHPSSHIDHLDPSTMVFFTLNDLEVGKSIPLYFPKRDPSTSPHFLPRDEANSIPFSSQELPHLLRFFSFSEDSPQAKAMEDTLRQCETNAIKGETKVCATSLESMLDFARNTFGLNSQFKILTTKHLTKSNTLFQNYTILETPEEISAPMMVACHTKPYPYAVLYCHSQETQNRVFKVSLGGENGDRVEAVAVCHLDTSQWSPNHVSFRVLRIEPGTLSVCHFFPADNFVLVPVAYSEL